MTMLKTINQTLISSMLIAGLFASITASTAAPQAIQHTDIEYPNLDDELSPCGLEQPLDEINQQPTPEAIKVGELSYISGGSCSDSVTQMKGLAKSFALAVVLVEKEGNKEVYIADVKVKVIDAKSNTVLDVVTEGAFLLVNLPDGQYDIIAEYGLESKRKRANINNKKHKRVVFLWDNEQQGPVESE